MKIMIKASRGTDSSYKMMEERNKVLRITDTDDYRYLSKMLNDEVKHLQDNGGHWSDYRPSEELREEAKARGYRVTKVRSKGAFPYAITLQQT